MNAPTKDALVLFMPSGRRGRFPHGTPVLDAARSLGVYIESRLRRARHLRALPDPGGGRRSSPSTRSPPSHDHLSPFTDTEARYVSKRGELGEQRRLSCSATIQGDLVVDVPQDVQINRQIVRKRAETRADRARSDHPALLRRGRRARHGEAARRHRPAAARARQGMAASTAPRIDFHLLPKVQKILREGEWKVTAAVHHDRGGPVVIALWPGLHNFACGIAVDIGSTTIACHLSSLLSGPHARLRRHAQPADPLRRGSDEPRLLRDDESGRARGDDQGGARGDRRADRKGLRRGRRSRPTRSSNASSSAIRSCTTSSSASIRPSSAARPSRSPSPRRCNFRASDLGLPVNEGARVYTLPCIAGHVGADAAGATLSEGPHRGEEITLLVDVGTNAEIVLGNQERLVAASSPTGPAFEGAEISGGQRAAPGAIERVRIDPVTLEPKVKVIGGDHWSDEPDFAETAATRRRHRHLRLRHHRGDRRDVPGRHHQRGRRHRRRARRAERPHRARPAAPSPTCSGAATGERQPGDPHPADRRARHPARQGGALCRHAAAHGQARHRPASTGSSSPAPSAPTSTRNTRW